MNHPMEYQTTAFYIFDLATLQARVSHLRQMLPPNTGLCYAMKANPFLVPTLAPLVERFELCSPGEGAICNQLGIPPAQTVISGIYKTPSVIEELVASSQGRIYTVESLTQFHLLHRLSQQYQRTLPILLRLTNDSQFGINEEDIRFLIANRAQYPTLDFLGLQFFSGTQKTSLKKLKRELGMLDDLLDALHQDYGYVARELEFGPGFPVAYFEGEHMDEEALLTGFSQLIAEMRNHPKLTLELGRSIAASCGTYYTHVVDSKRNKGQNYLLTDGGMHHLVYFGQHMAMKQPILHVVGKESTSPVDTFHICGALCSMNDILAKAVPLPAVEIGDVLCFANTGAYCMAEGISLFLSRELPAIYLKHSDGTYQCVRETMETYPLNTPQL